MMVLTNKNMRYSSVGQCDENEIKVLKLISKGMTNKDIAKELGMERSELDNVVDGLHRKTGKNRVLLAVWYITYSISGGGRTL